MRKHFISTLKFPNTLGNWQTQIKTLNTAELVLSTLVHDLAHIVLDYFKRMSEFFHFLSDSIFIVNGIATDGDISVYDHI